MDIHILLSLLHQLEQMRQRDRWTRQQLEAFQAEALRRLRAYAYSTHLSTSASTRASPIGR